MTETEVNATGAADAGVADVGAADAGVADVGAADAGVADVGAADAGVADVGAADVGVADAGAADAGVAEVAAEDAAAADRDVARKTVRRVFGRVVGDAAHKTVSVSIERVVRHPVYGKYIRRTTRVMAHDEDNACRLGDRVAIAECRPLSKRKSWRVVEVVGGDGATR